MYKFIGKKGQLYKFDPYEFIMKLNFNCPKSYKDGEGEGSCKGYKPGSSEKAKSSKAEKVEKKVNDNTNSGAISNKPIVEFKTAKDYRRASHADKLAFLKNEISKGNRSSSLPDGTTIRNIAAKVRELSKFSETSIIEPEVKQLVTTTKSVIEKVKKEKATGKVSNETKQELKNAINGLKNINESKKYTSNNTIKSETYENMINKTKELITNSTIYKPSIDTYIRDSVGISSTLIDAHDIINSNSNTKDKIKLLNTRIEPPSEKFVIDALRDITNIDYLMSKSKLEEPIIVNSGISKELYNKISNSKTFKSVSFISTSANPLVAEGYAMLESSNQEGYMLEIHVHKGTSALALDSYEKDLFKNERDQTYEVGGDGIINGNGSQDEVLLNRGLTFKVKTIETYNKEYKSANKNDRKQGKNIKINKMIIEAYER